MYICAHMYKRQNTTYSYINTKKWAAALVQLPKDYKAITLKKLIVCLISYNNVYLWRDLYMHMSVYRQTFCEVNYF